MVVFKFDTEIIFNQISKVIIYNFVYAMVESNAPNRPIHFL